MKVSAVLFFLAWWLSCAAQVPSGAVPRNILSVYSGAGFSAETDAFYGRETYTGFQFPAGLEWSSHRSKLFWKIYVNYSAGRVRIPYNEARLRNGSLGYDLGFTLAKFPVFRKNTEIFAGPAFFLQGRLRNQCNLSLPDDLTVFLAFSAGPDFGLRWNMTGKLMFTSIFRMNLLTYLAQDRAGAGFSGAGKTLIFSDDLALAWNTGKKISPAIRYRFMYGGLRKWEPLLYGSDELMLGLNMTW